MKKLIEIVQKILGIRKRPALDEMTDEAVSGLWMIE